MTQGTGCIFATLRKKSFHKHIRQTFVITAIVAFQLSIAMAQESDSSTPYKDAVIAPAIKHVQNPNAPQQQTPPVQPEPTARSANPQTPGSTTEMVTLPVGTKLQLALVRPLMVKKSNVGDTVYLQVTFPVSVGSEMVVPPGTYLQGVIGKIIRRDRVRALIEFELSSADLIFSTGYTVKLPGPLDAAPATAQLSPPGAGHSQNVPPVGAMAATGTTPPSLPTPSLSDAGRNAMIAVGATAAVGVVLFAVAAHHSDVEMQAGTPVQIVLQAPLELDRQRVSAAVQQYSTRAANNPPPIVQPPPKMCYDPGTPSTPPTVIPGSPGTPPTVIPGANGAPPTIIPGTPPTPDIVIPGTPGTPGRTYPCK